MNISSGVIGSCLMITLILPALLSAEPLEFFGYFESEFDYQRLRDKEYTMQYNKLRLDLQKRLSDKVFFGANIDYINYNGATEYSMLDIVPQVPIDTMPPQLRWYDFSFEDTIFVDNAFLQLSTDLVDLTIGRQQLSFGSGYAWNPTDIFNLKELFDPTYEQPGHNAIRIDAPVGTKGNFTAVWSVGDRWNYSKYFTRAKWRFGHFDLAASYGQTFSPRTIFIYPDIPSYEDRRLIYGGEFSGEIFGLGIWGEGAWNNMTSIDDYFEGLAGFDYTFSFQTSLLVEFYHNGYYASDMKMATGPEYSFNDWMRLIGGEIKSLAKNYLFTYVEHPVHDLINTGMFAIVNFDDRSFALNPQAVWYPYQDVEVTAIGNIGLGECGTEFGSFDPSGLIRVRVSF